jgi:hypothetical protein
MQRIVVGTGMARAASPFGPRRIGAEVTVDDAPADPAGPPTPPTSRVSPAGRSGG